MRFFSLFPALHFYQSKTGVPFVWPKLDIVGVENFTSLGMENWGRFIVSQTYLMLIGLMVFNLHYFLVSNSTLLNRRQRIARLVAHEVTSSFHSPLSPLSSGWT